MIWSVCKWCRKKFTRSDKGLCRQSDDLCTAAFASCNEENPKSAGIIIARTNAASKIIAKDVLLMFPQ